MNSLWNDREAAQYQNDPLQLRAYTSRLLGEAPDLVLHGGGNTSVKQTITNIFGETEEILFVKGSGWDLATIQTSGFAPVKMAVLRKLLALEGLSDAAMVHMQKSAMTDPGAPVPSVEAILHAVIPFQYVDHTHADAVVTITNSSRGEETIRLLYGARMLIIPYIMPGFMLAKKVYELTRDIDWKQLDGLILMHHGIFTFADQARESYEQMIRIVSQAERYLEAHASLPAATGAMGRIDLQTLAFIRRKISKVAGVALLAVPNNGPQALDFSNLPQVADLSSRGPLTPDHVIRTKRNPVVIGTQPEEDIIRFVRAYQEYFARNSKPGQTCLTPVPCWAVWPGHGTVAFGRNMKDAIIVADITEHTLRAIQRAEKLGGWLVLSEKDIFNMEYWELEQTKLLSDKKPPEFQGKIALVTGAAHGIGKACVEALLGQGAVVAALDIDPQISDCFNMPEVLELLCDVTDRSALQKSIEAIIRHFGGLDILISNAGIFPASENIENIRTESWNRSLAVNLSSHQFLLQACIPYLKLGVDPAVVIIASKNVPAPGPGVAAYSVAKAGLTQLGRVAALELAPQGIRVNVLHPHAVFDTNIWTPDVLQKRAEHYGMNVEAYKTNNLLKVEIKSRDVAALACAMVGPVFAKTTGAQIPIDGGNDRVI